MQTRSLPTAVAINEDQVWSWLAEVVDPEIPVVSVVDLGIVRSVRVLDCDVEIEVAPTYSGCPATEVIERSIVDHLQQRGLKNVVVKRVLAPAWTTDWISQPGRRKLLAYGIAPPARGSKQAMLDEMRDVVCPRCESAATSLVSEFGSTACKAAYRCDQCLEPFEYFKCI